MRYNSSLLQDVINSQAQFRLLGVLRTLPSPHKQSENSAQPKFRVLPSPKFKVQSTPPSTPQKSDSKLPSPKFKVQILNCPVQSTPPSTPQKSDSKLPSPKFKVQILNCPDGHFIFRVQFRVLHFQFSVFISSRWSFHFSDFQMVIFQIFRWSVLTINPA